MKILLIMASVFLFSTCSTSKVIKKTIYNKGNGDYMHIGKGKFSQEGILIRNWTIMNSYIGFSGFYILCDIESRKWMCYDSTDVLQIISKGTFEVEKNLLNKYDKKGNKIETFFYLGNGLFEHALFKSGEKKIIDTIDLIPKIELEPGCEFVD